MTGAGAIRQRGRHTDAVVAALRELRSGSAQDVFSFLRAGGSGVGLSTVYRELRALTAHGVTVGTRVGDETVYELLCRGEIVGRFLCQVCGRRERLGADEAGLVSRLLSGGSGLLSPDVPVVVQGVCRTCAAAGRGVGMR